MKLHKRVFKKKNWKERIIPKFSYSNINCPNFKSHTISVLFLNFLIWIEL